MVKRKALIAVDLGAQSCRVSLLRFRDDEPVVEVVHRFANGPVSSEKGLHWNIEEIWEGVQAGIRVCAALAIEGIASIGVDGWAVDYVRLHESGYPESNPFCYRDLRTEHTEKEVHALIPKERLYELTGTQILRINTIYQLFADKLAGKAATTPWINLPEYISYRLCGNAVAEYTNATHSGMVAVGVHRWCKEVFDATGLNQAAAPRIVASGTTAGNLRGDLAELSALQQTKVVVPACHDTASAIAAIPATGNDWSFVSSGTWSLVGTVLDSPCVSDAARSQNFTNLGGIGGKICFLKNVNGMWLLRQCMDEWESRGVMWKLEDLLKACESLAPPTHLIDVDAPDLMVPGDALAKINAQLTAAGAKPVVADSIGVPALANLIFHSLAERYAKVLRSIESITKKKLRRVFIVGGGNKNLLLNRLTGERSGLDVVLGSSESTTIGNFAIQLAALDGEWVPGIGVPAEAVAKWAQRLTSISVAIPAGAR
ncbi:MAG TPA: FGGY family carbohydrate kinase [Candidatus Sulfotelmatobacter sp.]|nr:FGGY family carbohydrate kinase [Candidatus Sulfotelmatobacter sp.]